MNINTYYDIVKKHGLAKTHKTFSTDFLCRGARYYDDLICTQRLPSVSALLRLFFRVRDLVCALEPHPDTAEVVTDLRGLLKGVGADLNRAWVSTLPRSRPAMPRRAPPRGDRAQSIGRSY